MNEIDDRDKIIQVLNEIWERQRNHNVKCWHNEQPVDDIEITSLHMNYALGLFNNATKLLNEYQWNDFLIERSSVDKHNMTEHAGDVFKYLISLMLLHRIEPKDFIDALFNKYFVTERKVMEKNIELSVTTKIIAFDIDGVLADYSDAFLDYIKIKKGLPDDIIIKQSEYHFANSLSKYITFEEEGKLAADFVNSGMVRKLTVYDGARELLHTLKSEGYKIILITARPYKRFRRMYSDTIYWLNSNGIICDKIIWQDNKADAIQSLYPAYTDYFVEDRDKHALEVSSLGVKVILIDKPYNRTLTDSDNIIRVNNIKEVLQTIKTLEETEND